jgi:hypothetical protein
VLFRSQGALFAIFSGVTLWLSLTFSAEMTPEQIHKLPSGLDWLIALIQPLQVFTPQGAGLIASALGMIAGSLLPQVFKHDPEVHDRLRKGEHSHHHHGHARHHGH